MTAGPLLPSVVEALKNIDVSILYFHTIKPLDIELLKKFNDKIFVVIHDAFGLKEMVQRHLPVPVYFHGITEDFLSSGTVHDIRYLTRCSGIRNYIKNSLMILELLTNHISQIIKDY